MGKKYSSYKDKGCCHNIFLKVYLFFFWGGRGDLNTFVPILSIFTIGNFKDYPFNNRRVFKTEANKDFASLIVILKMLILYVSSYLISNRDENV